MRKISDKLVDLVIVLIFFGIIVSLGMAIRHHTPKNDTVTYEVRSK